MKRIKIAQIGVGHDHAFASIETLKHYSNLFDLVGYAVVPEDSGNTDAFGFEGNKKSYEGVKRLSLDEILNYEGLDAVCIETEDRALTKYALMAAEKGLHIHMDKPGGIDQGEYDKLIDAAKRKGIVFHTGYMYRYNPSVMKLKEDIKAGKLGNIISVEAQMNCLHKLEKRNWLGNYPGGMLYFLGCHMVDLVYSIMGEPLEVLPLSCSSGLDGTKAQDFGMAVFRYKNGLSFAKSTAVEIGGYERRQLVVVGEKGTVELCPIEWSYHGETDLYVPQITGIVERFSDDWHEKGLCKTSEVFPRYEGMFKAFYDYVTGAKENPFTYEYERDLHKILLKACGKEG
jgi:predicted dehydrogenase